MAKSRFLKESAVVSSTIIFSPRTFNSVPADLADASNLISLAGNSLFSRSFKISCPTAPVAPTILIYTFSMNIKLKNDYLVVLKNLRLFETKDVCWFQLNNRRCIIKKERLSKHM